MSIYSIDGGSTAVQPAGTADKALDQTAFLKLMTAQLNAQDPFNPTDNSQMVVQMAQMSATTGIAEMNASLKTLVEDISGSRLGDMSGWIGRTALVDADHTLPMDDGSYAGEVRIDQDATALTLKLVDADGTVVHSQDFGAKASGSYSFDWDGKDGDGNAVAGPLRMVATATGAKGAFLPTPSTWTTVAGVQSPAGGGTTRLVTALGLIAPTGAQRLI